MLPARCGNRKSQASSACGTSSKPGGSITQYQIEKIRMLVDAISTTSIISAFTASETDPYSTPTSPLKRTNKAHVNTVFANMTQTKSARLRFSAHSAAINAIEPKLTASRPLASV